MGRARRTALVPRSCQRDHEPDRISGSEPRLRPGRVGQQRDKRYGAGEMTSEPQPAVLAEGLRKSYRSTRAVDGISFQVARGEMFGIVGPNGAGKTTAIECLEGLRVPDGGVIRVLGLDPQADGYALRERIGAQLQESALPARMRVGEAMRLFASFYARPLPVLPLLEELGLGGRARAAYAELSGGQRQRLAIALALVGDPELVFFDELTSGLDPQARHATWDLVREVHDRGRTVVLTTHYMEEAERLCDRVMIVDHGRVVALDSPAALIRGLDDRQRVTIGGEGVDERVLAAFRAVPGVRRVDRSNGQVLVYGDSDRFLAPMLGVLQASSIAVRDLRTEQVNLEAVFLALTGREMRD
jgi:ABC-2 type transport system ATP-binding protein